MATKLTLDPEFQAVVERARQQARERGDLRDGPWTGVTKPLPAETKAALRAWVDSGAYDRAVAEIVADDPDLQTQ
jgi:hypothetical protein